MNENIKNKVLKIMTLAVEFNNTATKNNAIILNILSTYPYNLRINDLVVVDIRENINLLKT